MNCCFESGIHEILPTLPHSRPNPPQDRLMVVRRSSPDHVVDGFRLRYCLWRYGREISQCRFCIVFDFFVTLKRWIQVFLLQVVFPQASLVWATSLLYQGSAESESSISSKICSFSCVRFSCCSSSTRQGMHPLISLEALKLRRMTLLQDTSCYQVAPKLHTSAVFSMQSDLIRQRNLSQ